MTRGMDLLDPWAASETKSSNPKNSSDAMFSLQRSTTQLRDVHTSQDGAEKHMTTQKGTATELKR